jgi:hypothetical protein
MKEQDKAEMLKSIKFANEFLKVTRGVKVAIDKPDSLPEEIIEHLANNELEDLINRFDLDPEMLIWGMVHILELAMKIAEIQPEQLANMLDEYIDWKEKNGD